MCKNCINDTFWPRRVTDSFVVTELGQVDGCTAGSDIQTSQKGEQNVLDNMKYTTKKEEVNAAYIRLMRYFMNI